MKTMEKEQKQSLSGWLKKLGVAGFLFFFIKGLVWLAVLFGVGQCAMG
jgi:energy-converting hydrogenase Eha subunit G